MTDTVWEWRDISTAPTEGSMLGLCRVGPHDVEIVSIWIGYHNGDKRYYDGEAISSGSYIRHYPTHWFPYPTHPTDASKVYDMEQCVDLEDKVDGLQSDLDNAIEVAFKRGAIEWTRLNYPDHYARLATVPLTYPVEYDVLPLMSELQDKVEPTDCYMLGSAMLEIYELRRALLEIAMSDDVDNMLDPNHSKRLARHAIKFKEDAE